jgi:hypothetical protein
MGVASQREQDPLNTEAENIVGIPYQATICDDRANVNIEDLTSVVVRSRVCLLTRVL